MNKMIRLVLPLAAACMLLAPAHAADFPNRPVRIVVPSSPGGGLDVLARLLGPRLAERWGQQVVIDNRPGADGVIGSEIVAQATPDGHTLLVVATGYSANPFLYRKLPYKTPQDFAPITIIGFAPNVLVVHPSVPAKNLKELIALAKAKPGELAYASSGVGTGGHLSMALLITSTGMKLIHVPYKGAGAATAALVGGQAQMLFTATAAAMPHVKSARIRALAVTSGERWPSMPDVPTVAEAGVPGYVVDGWYAMLAPGNTPKRLVKKIYDDVAAVMNIPEISSKIEAVGFHVSGMTPEEMARYVDRELKKWSTVIKEAGIRVD